MIRARKGADLFRIDMKAVAIPPLYDHHSHYALYSALHFMPSLAETTGHSQACDVIRNTAEGGITIMQGWNSSFFTLTPVDLENDRPVIVLNLSLHGMVMNRAAEDFLAAGYGDVVRGHNDPVWMERNLPRVLGILASLSPPTGDQIEAFGRELVRLGVGRMDDMLLPGAEWLPMAEDFPIPVDFWADEFVYGTLSQDERRHVKGVKLFTDGALGTCTAALRHSYISGEAGLLLFDDDELSQKLHHYMSRGIALAVHAIGDRAIDQVVETVGRIRRERGCSGPVRIEHAQFISLESAPGAREAGILLCMQPNFSLDSVMYRDRLPADYPSRNNPFRMLIDRAGFMPGRDLLFGSDGMPHGMIPALQAGLFPPFREQALTLNEFIAGYCLPSSDEDWWIGLDNNRVEILG